MANYKNFNRHDLFDTEMMSFHSATITKVGAWSMENDKKIHTMVYNMLCGIWDGYLYDTLLSDAKELGLPSTLLARIKFTIEVIELDIVAKGQTLTQV